GGNAHVHSAMGEDVGLSPAHEVELDARGQEREARVSQLDAALAPQHAIEMALEVVQIKHIGGRVFELGIRNLLRSPVRTLLLLAQVDIEQFPYDVLEPVSVRIGADEPRGDLGAKDRSGDDAE